MRKITLSILLLSFALNAFAGSVHRVELTPLEPTPLLSSSDFESARVSGQGDHAVLNLKLKDPAAQRLRDYTRSHVGQELPLLVDGKVTTSPVIRVPIEGTSLQVDSLSRKAADEVANFINLGK